MSNAAGEVALPLDFDVVVSIASVIEWILCRGDNSAVVRIAPTADPRLDNSGALAARLEVGTPPPLLELI
jgi:hypothetical protein